MTDESPTVAAQLIEEPIALADLFEDSGMELPGELGFEEWNRLGQNLLRISRGHQWWVGDWMVFGEEHYGEIASQAVDHLDLDPKTLMNYRRIAGLIPKRDRRDSLSWSHHRIAAELPTRALRLKVLKQADEDNMSTRDLDELVRSLMPKKDEPETAPDDSAKPKIHTYTLSFTVPDEFAGTGKSILDDMEKELELRLSERNVEGARITKSGN